MWDAQGLEGLASPASDPALTGPAHLGALVAVPFPHFGRRAEAARITVHVQRNELVQLPLGLVNGLSGPFPGCFNFFSVTDFRA